MKKASRWIAGLFLVSGSIALAQPADSQSPRPPPSVALNAEPVSTSAKVVLQVDTIPVDAKYVIYAEVNLKGLTIEPKDIAEVSDHLTQTCDQLAGMARQRGANLVVLLSNAHGADLRLRQCSQPLRLRSKDPRVLAILFQSASAQAGIESDSVVHFSTTMPPPATKGVSYTIGLQQDTAGITKAYWVYSNIARFVADADKYGLDTVALKSTSDEKYEEVPLPGCDESLRISTTKPELTAVIYKAAKPSPVSRPSS